MQILKSFLIWLLRALCVTSISGMVYLATVSTTLLDRGDVKQWTSASGIYDDDKLLSILFSAESIDTSNPILNSQNLVTNETLQKAATRTFDRKFLQTSFDTVIDSSYDWVEGKRASFGFSIPINAKRDTFIAELSKEIEAKVTALPVCGRVILDICRPTFVPVPAFTQQIIAETISQSDFLTSPLTETTFTTAAQGQDTAVLQRLPQLRWAVTILLYVLPFVMILAALGATLLSASGSRIKLFIKISREVFSSMILALILAGGVLVLLQAGGIPIEQLFKDAGPLAPLLAAFVSHMMGGFAWALILFAGLTLALSIISWIALHFINKTQRRPPEPITVTPTAPYPPHEQQTPSL